MVVATAAGHGGLGRNGAAGIIVVTYTPGAPSLSVRTIRLSNRRLGPSFDVTIIVTEELGRVTSTARDPFGRTRQSRPRIRAVLFSTRRESGGTGWCQPWLRGPSQLKDFMRR